MKNVGRPLPVACGRVDGVGDGSVGLIVPDDLYNTRVLTRLTISVVGLAEVRIIDCKKLCQWPSPRKHVGET